MNKDYEHMKLELQGIIPSKPEGQTIFEDPYVEKETYGIIMDFNEWVNLRAQEHSKYNSDPIFETNFVFDHHLAGTLLKKHFDGFMTQPTALFEGNAVVAKSRVIRTIEDVVNVKTLLEKYHGSKKRFLLDFSYWFPRWRMYTLDEKTFQPILLETPVLNGGSWKIRYGVLGED